MIKYFISYVYSDDGRALTGFGHCDIGRESPIRSGRDLMEIMDLIRNAPVNVHFKNMKVNILFWQRYDGN